MSWTLERVRSINNDYRTAAMNRRYYACRLRTVQSLNRWLEIIVALSSSGTIAAWSVWGGGSGAAAWKMLAALAAIVAVVKPFLGLSKDIERYSELTLGYTALYFDMKELAEDLRTSGSLPDGLWLRYSAVRQRFKELGLKDDLVPRKRLHRRCFDEVNKELSAKTLWWPSEETV